MQNHSNSGIPQKVSILVQPQSNRPPKQFPINQIQIEVFKYTKYGIKV